MRTVFGKPFRLTAILLCLLVLTIGMGVAAAAAEFTDSSSIGVQYKSAVGSMADKGILNGFPDGSFLPDGTLTREQGAKIVTYMVLGSDVDRLTCTQAPFQDVAADRWSAPCVSWCVDRLILLGYGDGRFGPEDRLTGDQFAKMLLCSMKLAREGNYVGLGDSWFTAVREDARAAELYEGDETMATGLPINREQAALMAWNALRAAEPGFVPAIPDPQPPTSPEPGKQPGTGSEVPPVVPVKPGPGNDESVPGGDDDLPGADPDPDPVNPVPILPVDPDPVPPPPADPDPVPPPPVDPDPVPPPPVDPDPADPDDGDIVLPEVP